MKEIKIGDIVIWNHEDPTEGLLEKYPAIVIDIDTQSCVAPKDYPEVTLQVFGIDQMKFCVDCGNGKGQWNFLTDN